MKTKVKYRFFAALVCLLSASGAVAEEAAASRLTSLLARVSTLQADVDQLTMDQQGREVQAATAQLKMRKPDHFYWHATSPYEEVMVTNGELLWIYEPDLEQVTIERFNAATTHTPAMLLSSDAATLTENFVIEVDELPEDGLRFMLYPRQPEALFEELILVFYRQQLEEMQFEDSLGQRTSLYFLNMQINPALDDGIFEFTAPAGVEIIDSGGVDTL